MKRIAKVVSLLMVAMLSCGAQAQQGAKSSPWSFGIGVGGFDPDDGTGRLKNQSGQYSLAFDAAYRYSDYLSFAFDIFANDQRFDAPPTVPAPFLGTVDGRAHITGGGFNAVAKFGIPAGPMEPYIGAALGLYFNSMIVTGSVLGLPARVEEQDSDLGEQLLAGVNFWISERWALGVEYRRTFLKADFGSLSNGEVDIGGDSLMLTLRGGSR